MGDMESKAVGFDPLHKAYGFGLHQYPLKIYRWINFAEDLTGLKNL